MGRRRRRMKTSLMKTPRRQSRLRLAALLVIDMISDFRFEDGAAIARAALPAAHKIRALRARAVAKGVPTLFVNDNLGHWKSDFRQILTLCRASGCCAPLI
jgi:hypothetical protein